MFDPMEWEGDTLYARWEAWYFAQEWANDLPSELMVDWNEHAREQMPPMVPQDWIDAIGVDAMRGGHLVKDRRVQR
ncbi:hypothetical protein ACSBQY_11635 [Micrococcus lylae]|uniref:hypothetical protein n=1 Tax=Micrococcus lylae TaxID=1273 RepID=UPI003EBE516B